MPKRIKRRSELNKPIGRSAVAARRGSPRQLGYDTAWERIAKQRRDNDFGLCQECLLDGWLTVSQDVDHIIPLHVRPDWRLEFDNTQVLCRTHHRCKTEADSKRYGSSTATELTIAQQNARLEAQQLEQPPCATPGGEALRAIRDYGTSRERRVCFREIGDRGGSR